MESLDECAWKAKDTPKKEYRINTCWIVPSFLNHINKAQEGRVAVLFYFTEDPRGTLIGHRKADS